MDIRQCCWLILCLVLILKMWWPQWMSGSEILFKYGLKCCMNIIRHARHFGHFRTGLCFGHIISSIFLPLPFLPLPLLWLSQRQPSRGVWLQSVQVFSSGEQHSRQPSSTPVGAFSPLSQYYDTFTKNQTELGLAYVSYRVVDKSMPLKGIKFHSD